MDWACSNFCGKNLQKILSENWRLTEYRSSHNCICLTIILNNELTGTSFNINPYQEFQFQNSHSISTGIEM
jgi:hypothetical protein